jgi:hypothetical protein
MIGAATSEDAPPWTIGKGQREARSIGPHPGREKSGMMKYICLGYYDKSKFDAMTESERNAMFDACFDFDDNLRAKGNWATGEALEPAETALTLSWRNGKVATTDGPYAETKEQLGGIGFLEARDMNHAVQLIGQHPSLAYGTIWEVRAVGDLTEMRRASDERRKRAAAR